MSKSTEEAYDLLEKIATNNYQWSNKRGMPRRMPGMYELDGINMLNAKVDSLIKIFDNYSTANTVLSCDWYGGAHLSFDCQQVDQAQIISNGQQSNFYSNNYNPGWRNHPNSIGEIKIIRTAVSYLIILLVFSRDNRG